MTEGQLYKHSTFTFFRRLASSSDCDTILGSQLFVHVVSSLFLRYAFKIIYS